MKIKKHMCIKKFQNRLSNEKWRNSLMIEHIHADYEMAEINAFTFRIHVTRKLYL
jgi:hypothetical protein